MMRFRCIFDIASSAKQYVLNLETTLHANLDASPKMLKDQDLPSLQDRGWQLGWQPDLRSSSADNISRCFPKTVKGQNAKFMQKNQWL